MEGYTTARELIAEVKGRKIFSDNPNLVDEVGLERQVWLALKQFGLNIMQKYETVVRVKKGVATLPENFAKLSLAVHCTPFMVNHDGDNNVLYQHSVTRERILCFEEDSCELCTGDCSDKYPTRKIVENIYLPGNYQARFVYAQPMYVRLGRDVMRGGCTSDCINKAIKDAPYSINIKGRTVYANFDEGSLYIEYYGLPQTDDGDPIIPETDQGYLEQYIEAKLINYCLLDGIMSEDLTNKNEIYKLWLQREEDLFDKAKVDTSPFNMNTLYNAIRRRKHQMNKFNIFLGAIRGNYITDQYTYNYSTTLPRVAYA